jgi:hypothetical protein
MPARKKTSTVQTLSIVQTSSNEILSNIIESTANSVVEKSIVEKPVKAKREKKTSKHKVVAIVTPEGIEGGFQTEMRRPLIVHLPIHTNDIHFHEQPLTYDPRPPCQPEPFNADWCDPFASEAMFEKAPEKEVVESSAGVSKTPTELQPMTKSESNTVSLGVVVGTGILSNTLGSAAAASVASASVAVVNNASAATTFNTRKEYGPTTLLAQYINTKYTKMLPSQTDLACFWCCETFSGRPCVIPTHVSQQKMADIDKAFSQHNPQTGQAPSKSELHQDDQIVQNVWDVYGNFCTPQCGMAYLLSEILDTHTRWERIALLNRLYVKHINGRIYPAPSRESLQRFGGPITSQEFRSICENQSIRVDIHMPPMVSILASMDTKPIDFYETPLRNTFASPHQIAIQRNLDEPVGLKLRRTKPLKDKESTLDSCLQIKIK